MYAVQNYCLIFSPNYCGGRCVDLVQLWALIPTRKNQIIYFELLQGNPALTALLNDTL